MKKRKNRSTNGIIITIERVKDTIIGVLTNEVILAYFVPLETLPKIGQLIIEAAVVNSKAK